MTDDEANVAIKENVDLGYIEVTETAPEPRYRITPLGRAHVELMGGSPKAREEHVAALLSLLDEVARWARHATAAGAHACTCGITMQPWYERLMEYGK